MRLTKIKCAGFKSFADPTSVGFPSNLTGVVGPNGCGKSNIIDAVRWVMGELSAKHLRGDSMTDVIFNGSASRKPVGTASVELVFDNSDGKLSGPYGTTPRSPQAAGVARRFLELLPQRRALPPQGHHAAVPGYRSGIAQLCHHRAGHDLARLEARPTTCAFRRKAAGISRYKERRKETEARISTRAKTSSACRTCATKSTSRSSPAASAATARRYQALKETERRLTAELLRCACARSIRAPRCRTRGARMRAQHAAGAGRPARGGSRHRNPARLPDRTIRTCQRRAGSLLRDRAEISRTEQSIEHTRALREQQRNDSPRRAPRSRNSIRISNATSAK